MARPYIWSRCGCATPDAELRICCPGCSRSKWAGMRLALGVAVLTLLATGCASSGSLTTRDEVIRKILPSTVQLRCEPEGGGPRSASGVVVASDAVTRRSWIVTARHFLEPPTTQQIKLTATGSKVRTKLVVVASSTDADVTLLAAEGILLPAVEPNGNAQLAAAG